MASRGWTCRKTACATLNAAVKQKCEGCGARRPKRRVPAHRKALRDNDYAAYLSWNQEIHGAGEECAICGKPPRTRRLDRDHDHATGDPRGLLDARCNQRLERGADTEEWLAAALAYVRRANAYWAAGAEEEAA